MVTIIIVIVAINNIDSRNLYLWSYKSLQLITWSVLVYVIV